MPCVMQLPIHACGIGKLDGVDVELPHAGPVEPVDDHDIERITALAIAVGDLQHLLSGVS